MLKSAITNELSSQMSTEKPFSLFGEESDTESDSQSILDFSFDQERKSVTLFEQGDDLFESIDDILDSNFENQNSTQIISDRYSKV